MPVLPCVYFYTQSAEGQWAETEIHTFETDMALLKPLLAIMAEVAKVIPNLYSGLAMNECRGS